MVTWIIENKPKILNLFNFQKIQSFDFHINLHIASIASMEINVDCITKALCSKFVLRLSLNRISAKFRQILKEYVGFKILSFIYNANKSQQNKRPHTAPYVPMLSTCASIEVTWYVKTTKTILNSTSSPFFP